MSYEGVFVDDKNELISNESGHILVSVIDEHGKRTQHYLERDIVQLLENNKNISTEFSPEANDRNDNEAKGDGKEPKDNDEENNTLSINSTSLWSTETTRRLLDLHLLYFKRIGPGRQFGSKNAMFEKISQDLCSELEVAYTGTQCMNRFKTVRQKQETAIQKNRTSGEVRHEVPFSEEREKLKAVDDSIEPEVCVGVGVMSFNKKHPDELETTSKTPKKREPESTASKAPRKRELEKTISKASKKKKADIESLLECYLENQRKSQESKERRHRERIDAFNKSIDNSKGEKSLKD